MNAEPIKAGSRSLRKVALAGLVLAALVAGCGGRDSDTATSADSAGTAGTPEVGSNVVRVPGLSSTDVAAAADLIAYPPGKNVEPGGFVLYPRDDWRRAALAAQFVAAPVNGALLPSDLQFLPAAASDLVTRMKPTGFPSEPKIHALLLGEPGDDVVLAFQQQHLNLTKLPQSDPTQLSAELVAYRGGWAKKFADEIIVVSSEDADRPYALIAAAWSAFTGDTLVFVNHDSVPAATKEVLDQRQKLRLVKPNIWIVGPDSAVPEGIASELGAYGQVHRVGGDNPVETSVEMAKLRDQATGFGWGLTRAPVNISLVNEDDWGDAAGALQLAGSGPRSALLLTDSADHLPDAITEYLRSLQGPQPSQGYVMGDRGSISSTELTELDGLLGAGQAPAEKTKKKTATGTTTASK
jgi:putative cell wall-binding protein